MSIDDHSANRIIESQLQERCIDLEKVFSADVISLIGGIRYGVENYIREAVEAIPNKREKLAFVLETSGGYIEVAQRIVDIIRTHYSKSITFIVPDYAMSAGTVLVMSGDEIYMDYFSILGPIDPQIENREGRLVPALGYLIQYQRLIDKAAKGKITSAEITYLVERFDPAELYRYEQARELSIALLKEWLVKYKFKNWEKTATHGRKVTKEIKVARAKQIAQKLNDTDRWLSHGRGIPIEVLKKDLNIIIEDFGASAGLSKAVKCYYNLLGDYMVKRSAKSCVHTREGFSFLR